MKVTLEAMTKPVTDNCQTTSQLLAYFARVSSTANQKNHATGSKLLSYLIRNKEWSPLEMVNLVFYVETERDVARQMLRHSVRPQEFSFRYASLWAPLTRRRARLQDKKNRQNSIETDAIVLQLGWSFGQWAVAMVCQAVYALALKSGIAKEVARSVLPEGMTMSRMYLNGNVREWIHYCQARCDPKTQKEHRMVAAEIRKVLLQQFPDLASALQ